MCLCFFTVDVTSDRLHNVTFSGTHLLSTAYVMLFVYTADPCLLSISLSFTCFIFIIYVI